MSRNKVLSWRFSRVVVAAVMCSYFGVMIYIILSSLKKDENLLMDLTKFAEDQNKRLSYLESTFDKLVNGRLSAFDQRVQHLEQQAQLNQISTAAAMAKGKTHHPDLSIQEEIPSRETPAIAGDAGTTDGDATGGPDATMLSRYFAKDTTVNPQLIFHFPSKNNHNNQNNQNKQKKPMLPIRDDVYVLSISSRYKRELQTAQLETFGQIFTMIFVEEMHTPLCVRCTASGAVNTLDNNLGWNCAQQRTLQALRLFLSQVQKHILITHLLLFPHLYHLVSSIMLYYTIVVAILD